MSLARISVKRPVATSMFFLGVVLMGIIAWLKLPNELFPPITYPQLTVITPYPNAAPEEVESLITKKIEEGVGTVRGLKGLKSYSNEGVSMVVANFDWGTNMDFASLNMREKIDLVKGSLPDGAMDPTVVKFNPFTKPLMVLSVTGNYNEADLLSIVKTLIRDKLEKVEGVAAVSISGGLEREIKIEVDQKKLLGAQQTMDKVINSLVDSNLNYPAGETEDEFYEWLIRTMGEFETVDEINNVVVGTDDVTRMMGMGENNTGEKRLIFLKDIAEITDTVKEKTSYSRFGINEGAGKSKSKVNISLSIQKQASANTIFTADRIKETLIGIKGNLPVGVFIQVVDDQSVYIRKSIQDVVKNGLNGGILAFLVLLFFLRNLRSAFIVSMTIPISIMFVMAVMYFSKMTINIMSLGGLVLGIGMLVDNAIVIIENISRHRQFYDKEQIVACVDGTEEVSGAVCASTYTTIAVFLPLVFVVGLVGQVFKEVAFTVTFSQISALIVGLSLIPRLAMNEKKRHVKENRFSIRARRIVEKIEDFYMKLLDIVLKRKKLFLLGVLAVFLCSFLIFPVLKKEALPKMDQRKFDVNITFPKGTTLETTNAFTKKIEDLLLNMEDIDNVGTIVGSNTDMSLGEATKALGSNEGKLIVSLKQTSEKPTNVVIQEIKDIVESRPAELAIVDFVALESIFATGGEDVSPVYIEVKGENYNTMENIVARIKEQLRKVSGVFGIKDSISEKSPETRIIIDKERAALYNVSIKDVAQVAQVAIQGFVATKFREEGKEIDVLVKCRERDVDTLDKIGNLRVGPVYLREVAMLKKGKGPSEIVRKDQQRLLTVTANIYRRAFSDVAADIKRIISKLELPEGYLVALTGENEQMQDSFASLKMILSLSVLFVYMIMAAQFESLWQPFIIMFTVPLAVIGVFLSLLFSGASLNAISLIGLVLLAGIVVNNGIVLIEYINEYKGKGKDIVDVVRDSCRDRFRPIIMTMLTTLLGVLPLAVGLGGRGELMQPMAITTFGGLFVSTCLTLFVVPCLFLIAESKFSRSKK